MLFLPIISLYCHIPDYKIVWMDQLTFSILAYICGLLWLVPNSIQSPIYTRPRCVRSMLWPCSTVDLNPGRSVGLLYHQTGFWGIVLWLFLWKFSPYDPAIESDLDF